MKKKHIDTPTIYIPQIRRGSTIESVGFSVPVLTFPRINGALLDSPGIMLPMTAMRELGRVSVIHTNLFVYMGFNVSYERLMNRSYVLKLTY